MFFSVRARLVSRLCVAIVIAAAAVQLADLFASEDASPWFAMGALYLSSAAIGLDAVVHGVRKDRTRGISIANLAPGGWAIFASMFWIVAVPAYFAGARRKRLDDDEREPVRWGSWVAIALAALMGITLMGVAATS